MANHRGNSGYLLKKLVKPLINGLSVLFSRLFGVRVYIYEWDLQLRLQDQPFDDQLAADWTETLCQRWYEELCPAYKNVQFGELLIDRMAGVSPGILHLIQQTLQATNLLHKILSGSRRRGLILSIAGQIASDHLIVSQLARHSNWQFVFLRSESALKRELKSRIELAQTSERHEGNPYMIAEEQLLAWSPQPAISKDGGRPCIVVVASLNNYLNPMVPVIQALQARGYSVVVIVPRRGMAWSNVRQLRDKGNIELLCLEEMVSEPIAKAIGDYAQQCEKAWEAWRDEFRKRMKLESIDLWDVIEFSMRNTVVKQLPVCAGYLEIADIIFSELRPVCVLAARPRKAFEKAFFMRAHQGHIPTVQILHGHVGNFPASRFYGGRFRHTTAIATWGEFQSEEVRRLTATPSPLIVATGNPQWDTLAARADSDESAGLRRDIAARLGLVEQSINQKHWVLFLTQNLTASWFEDIRRSIDDLPSLLMLVKVHPHEHAEYYEHAVRSANSTAIIIPHGVCDLWDLLLCCDSVMTYDSTAGLEGLLAKKPLITVDFTSLGKCRTVNVGLYGLPVVRNPATLRIVMERIGTEPAYRQELHQAALAARKALLANAHVPSATSEIVNLIERVVACSIL